MTTARVPRAGFLILLLLIAACGEEPESPSGAAAPALSAPAPDATTTLPSPPDRPAEAPEPSPVLSEKWYSEYVDDQHSGWVHVTWTRSRLDGRETIHDHTERYHVSTRSALHGEDRFEAQTVIDVERLPDGSLLTMRAEVMQGGRPLVTEQRFTGDGYDWEQRVAGHVEKRRVACDRPVPTDSESFLGSRMAGGDLEPGTVFEYPVPDFREGKLRRIRLTVEGYEILPLAAGPCRCVRVREALIDAPVSSTLWIDDRGVLRKLTSAGMVLTSTTRERACELSPTGYRFTIIVTAEPNLPRATSLDRSVIEVSLRERAGVEAPDFPDSPFSREISRDGLRHVLELTSHEDPEATVALPVTTPEVARWLESDALFCSDSPEVREAARGAIGDETDGRVVARLLLAYVFTSLRKFSGPIPDPTAIEILRDGGGDCSEHAVLFVALCRAVGLPARRVSGYAQVGEVWGSHSFTEIWLGKWVGADPTTNELGTRARYLCFGWPDEPDSYPGVVSNRVRDRMRIRTLEFEEDGRTVLLSDPPAGEGNSELLSGLTLAEVPEGWTAEFLGRGGMASIRGPGFRCVVQVRSGYGDLPAEILKSYFLPMGEVREFAGISALAYRPPSIGTEQLNLMVPYRRRFLELTIAFDGEADEEAVLAGLATVLGPTLR